MSSNKELISQLKKLRDFLSHPSEHERKVISTKSQIPSRRSHSKPPRKEKKDDEEEEMKRLLDSKFREFIEGKKQETAVKRRTKSVSTTLKKKTVASKPVAKVQKKPQADQKRQKTAIPPSINKAKGITAVEKADVKPVIRHIKPTQTKSDKVNEAYRNVGKKQTARKWAEDSSSDDEIMKQIEARRAGKARKPVIQSSSSSDDEFMKRLEKKRTGAAKKHAEPKKAVRRPVLPSSSSSDDELMKRIELRRAMKEDKPVKHEADRKLIGEKPISSMKSPPRRIALSDTSSDEEIFKQVKATAKKIVQAKPSRKETSSDEEVLKPKVTLTRVEMSSSSDELLLKRPQTTEPVAVANPKQKGQVFRIGDRTFTLDSSSDSDVQLKKPTPTKVPQTMNVSSGSSDDEQAHLLKKPVSTPHRVDSSSSSDLVLPERKSPTAKRYDIQKILAAADISDSSDEMDLLRPKVEQKSPKAEKTEKRSRPTLVSSESDEEVHVRSPVRSSPEKPQSPLSISGPVSMNAYKASEKSDDDETFKPIPVHSTPKSPVVKSSSSSDDLAVGSSQAAILRKYGISDSSEEEVIIRPRPERVIQAHESDEHESEPYDDAQTDRMLKERLAAVGLSLSSDDDQEIEPVQQKPKPMVEEVPKGLEVKDDLENDEAPLHPDDSEKPKADVSAIMAELGIEDSSDEDEIEPIVQHESQIEELPKPQPEDKQITSKQAKMTETYDISSDSDNMFSLTQPSPKSSLTPSPIRSSHESDGEDFHDEQPITPSRRRKPTDGIEVIDDVTPDEILISSLSNSGELRAALQSVHLPPLEEEDDDEEREPVQISGSEEEDDQRPYVNLSNGEEEEVQIRIEVEQRSSSSDGCDFDLVNDPGDEATDEDFEEKEQTEEEQSAEAVIMVDDEYISATPTIRRPTPRPGGWTANEEDDGVPLEEELEESEEEQQPVRPIPLPKPARPIPMLPKLPLSRTSPEVKEEEEDDDEALLQAAEQLDSVESSSDEQTPTGKRDVVAEAMAVIDGLSDSDEDLQITISGITGKEIHVTDSDSDVDEKPDDIDVSSDSDETPNDVTHEMNEPGQIDLDSDVDEEPADESMGSDAEPEEQEHVSGDEVIPAGDLDLDPTINQEEISDDLKAFLGMNASESESDQEGDIVGLKINYSSPDDDNGPVIAGESDSDVEEPEIHVTEEEELVDTMPDGQIDNGSEEDIDTGELPKDVAAMLQRLGISIDDDSDEDPEPDSDLPE